MIRSDLADAFPHGEFADLYRVDWLTAMAREVRSNRDFQARTQDTARWAREQIKRQIGIAPSSLSVLQWFQWAGRHYDPRS